MRGVRALGPLRWWVARKEPQVANSLPQSSDSPMVWSSVFVVAMLS